MEQQEVMQRVVGVITEALEKRRLVRESPQSADNVELGSVIGEMLTEMMPRIELPSGSTAHELGEAISREFPPAIEKMAAAFILAAVRLAEVHDEGRSDRSSADVLQALALDHEAEAGQ
ncbi:hypothetical protein ACH470_31490 [Streptomyces bottropensis]|uniref:hypothetical protein n=1 Tax=Streptomyces bottropensis TaxID=42235 RepID=UPI0037991367